MILSERITEQAAKTQQLEHRLAAIPAEIVDSSTGKAKTLAAEWQTVRADYDLALLLYHELQRQQTAALRGELVTQLDELTGQAGSRRIENREHVKNLEKAKKALQTWHNSPERHGVDERATRQKTYLDMKEKLGRAEGLVALSATALRDAEGQRDQARNRLTEFERLL